VLDIITEEKGIITKRNKILKIADKYGWDTVKEYLDSPLAGDTISCNGTERNETKRKDFVSCFSNYYRNITILRNETIPFRFVPFRF
jgi:hypothetical protein